MKFVNNRMFKILNQNIELSRYTQDNKTYDWDIFDTYPNNIFNKLIESDLYKDYMNSGNDSFDEDQEFIVTFFEEFIAEYEDLHDWFEGIQLNWADDF